ncbi:MAG: hypothetical protein P0S95_05925 [Rhabdochlamydiaceae bacterium]|nr:hypothetical protein [Candidatus Amphrikana amoebophyrae]
MAAAIIASLPAITAEMAGVTSFLQGVGAFAGATTLVYNYFPNILKPIFEGLGTLFYWCNKDEFRGYMNGKNATSDLGVIKYGLVQKIMEATKAEFSGTVQLKIDGIETETSSVVSKEAGLESYLRDVIRPRKLSGNYSVEVIYTSSLSGIEEKIETIVCNRMATLFSCESSNLSKSSITKPKKLSAEVQQCAMLIYTVLCSAILATAVAKVDATSSAMDYPQHYA